MKKIIISGTSSGIGRALTEQLLQQNIQVVGLARDHSKFQPDNANYFPYSLDFSLVDELETELNSIKKNHHDIDALISCAGYGHFGELEQFSVAQIQRLMDVNFTSQAIFIKTFLPLLKQKSSSKIIVLGSESALNGAKKGSIYCASKFALRGFCQSLSQECRKTGISVTLINPGLVRTPFFKDLNFEPADNQQHALEIEDVVDTLMMALTAKPHCVIDEINLQPLQTKVQFK